jgi:hypothetical protein
VLSVWTIGVLANDNANMNRNVVVVVVVSSKMAQQQQRQEVVSFVEF